MDSRAKTELTNLFLKQAISLSEMPDGFEFRKLAKEEGYLYLKISVTDMETGEPLTMQLRALQSIPPSRGIYTVCKHENLDELLNNLLTVAQWPDDFLEQLHPSLIINAEILTTGKHNAKQIAGRQILGGRKKGSRTEKTRQKYATMLRLRWSQKWYARSSKEFFEAFPKYNYKSLARATKWHLEGRP